MYEEAEKMYKYGPLYKVYHIVDNNRVVTAVVTTIIISAIVVTVTLLTGGNLKIHN